MTGYLARSLTVLSVVLLVGCGGRAGQEPTASAGGVVTYNGQPVPGATVIFGPTSGQSQGATAVTDAAGRFKLSTYGEHDGAIAGTYSVTIIKRETAAAMTEDEEHEAISAGRDVSAAQARNVIPPKYSNAATSGLTAEVASGTVNEFEFVLVD
jgi:hypothetical protein